MRPRVRAARRRHARLREEEGGGSRRRIADREVRHACEPLRSHACEHALLSPQLIKGVDLEDGGSPLCDFGHAQTTRIEAGAEENDPSEAGGETFANAVSATLCARAVLFV
jgi:hypothetical protein